MRYCNCLLVFILIHLMPGICGATPVAAADPPFDSLYRFLLSGHQKVTVARCITLAEVVRDTMPMESFRLLQRAQEIAIISGNHHLKATAKMAMADFYAARSKYMLAQDNYVKVRKMYCFINDTTGTIKAYIKLGLLSWLLDNPENSRDCYSKGMALAAKSGHTALMASLLYEDAKVLQNLRQTEKAGEQYRKGLVMARRAGDRAMYEKILCHMGAFYLDRGEYREAIRYYQDLTTMIDTNGPLVGMIYTRIGHAYASLGMNKVSLYYNRKALDSRQRHKDLSGIVSSEINIGGDFYHLHQPDSAKYHLEKGRILAIRCNYLNFIANSLRHEYEYYLSEGDFKKATDCYKLYCRQLQGQDLLRKRSHIELHDAMQKIDSANEATKALIEDARIVKLSHANRNYQEYTVKGFIFLIAVILCIFILQYYLSMVNNRKVQLINLRLSEEKEKRIAADMEIVIKEKQYRFLTENSLDFITQMDSNLNRTYASPSSFAVYGFTPEEMLVQSPYDVTHPDFHAYAEEKAKLMADSRAPVHLILQAIKKDGRYFWIESILNPLFDSETGTFRGMVGVTRDIQERKNKEIAIMEGTLQKENLLKEIHHRVKNNFAILVSLINMQLAQTKNPELVQSLTNLQLRIRTMSLVHEMLYRSKDFENISFAEYLRSVCSVIAGTYNRRDVELTFEADNAVMDIEASIPLGLIVNELLSNAYKHAFREESGGQICVRFINDTASGVYKLIICDNGIGMPGNVPIEQYTTMGLQIVQILCRQIEGTLTLTNTPGATYTLEFKQPACA